MKNIMNQYDTWNNQAIADAIDLFQGMIEKGYFGTDAEKRSNDEAKANFINGKCAFYQNGTWNTGDISKSEYNIKVGEFPVIDPEYSQLGELLGGPSEVLSVAETSRYAGKSAEIAVELSRMVSNYLYIDGAGLSAWRVYKDDSGKDTLTKEALDMGLNAKSFLLFGDTIMYPEELDYYMYYMNSIFDRSVTGKNFITEMSDNLR